MRIQSKLIFASHYQQFKETLGNFIGGAVFAGGLVYYMNINKKKTDVV